MAGPVRRYHPHNQQHSTLLRYPALTRGGAGQRAFCAGADIKERESAMPYLSKYHIAEQQASVLLGPVLDALRELEGRTVHYAARLHLTDADQEAMLAAHQAIAAARAEIERIRADSARSRGSDV